jgi:hypothetical protein
LNFGWLCHDQENPNSTHDEIPKDANLRSRAGLEWRVRGDFMYHESTAIHRRLRGAIISMAAVFAAVFSVGAGAARAQKKAEKSKGPDLPYTTIDHPQFVLAAQASFLGPKDIVLGVSDGKMAKAYPAAILSQHGVVQDSVADGPIAITW